MCVREEERNYRLIVGRRIALSWSRSCSSAMRKMRNFTQMTPVKLSQGSVVMLILQSIVRRGCFVSGLPSNLCHSRSSAAAVVTFQLCWILNERWKMTCFPDTCQSHTGFCTNSIAELDKGELTPSSRQRPIYSIKTSWNSLTFSKRSIDQDLKRTRSSKEDVFLCVV